LAKNKGKSVEKTDLPSVVAPAGKLSNLEMDDVLAIEAYIERYKGLIAAL
jgi:hypothetical protein